VGRADGGNEFSNTLYAGIKYAEGFGAGELLLQDLSFEGDI